MNDTGTRLMGLIDEYAMRCSTAHVSIEPARQALQDELTKVCADAAAYRALNAELDRQMGGSDDRLSTTSSGHVRQ